jgi:hypothetical protein
MSFDIQNGPPGPRNGESRGDQTPALAQQQSQANDYRQSNRQVAWLEVHLWRDRMLEQPGVQSFPVVGTPLWCALPDDHPVKLAAAVDAAQHHALRADTAQEQLAAAAQAISAAEDWSAIARANRDRADFLAANPWARRVVEDGSAKAAENAADNEALAATANEALCREAENAAEDADSASTPPNAADNAAAEDEAMDAGTDMHAASTHAASTALDAAANAWAGRVAS